MSQSEINQVFTATLRDLLAIAQRQAAELDLHRRTVMVLMDAVCDMVGIPALDLPAAPSVETLERAARGLAELEKMFAEGPQCGD